MQGAKLVVGAKLTTTNAAICPLAGRTVTFTFSVDPTDGVGVLTRTAVTDASGQATLTIDTALSPAWQPGTYDIHVAVGATAGCFASFDDSVVTVASPADAATGGGAYQYNGRVNFGFNVHRVGTATPAVYKGQLLLMNNGKWRLKATLDAFTKLAAGATGNRCGAGFVMGSAEGTGKLQYWDATNGAWLLSQDPVRFSITFCDNTVTGKRVDPDKFGIIIDYALSTTPKTPPEPSSLPNSLPIALSNSNANGGGNISIKK